MARRGRSSAVAFHKLNAFDKRSRGAVSSGRGGVHAETDPGDARSTVLAEVTLERGVEVKFGHYCLVGFRFAQANEASAGMKVPAFIRKIDLIVVTQKEPNKIRAVGNQDVAAGDALFAEEDIKHQRFVVDLASVRHLLRILDNAPRNSDSRYFFKIHGVVQEKPPSDVP